MQEWTTEWPQKPGLYLFYGCEKDTDDNIIGEPSLHLCNVVEEKQKIVHMIGSSYIQPDQYAGVFRPFDLELPDLDEFLEDDEEEEKEKEEIVYGVPWVEVEFGMRSEGWSLFLDKENCIKSTKKSSKNGAYTDENGKAIGGYYGPIRPLYYVEIPFSSLEKEIKKKLKKKGSYHTENRWSPRFTGERVSI